jgi:hypothetical protein
LISCFNVKVVFESLKTLSDGVRNHPKSPWARNTAHPATETELESLHRPKTNDDPPPPYSSTENDENAAFAIPSHDDFISPEAHEDAFEPTPQSQINEPERNQIWAVSPARKVIDLVLVSYSTYRAAVAFIIQFLGLVDKHTPSCAPSNLLLILVSVQIMLSNVSFPRIIRFVLTLDVLLVATAFTIAAYAPLSNPRNSSYAPLNSSSSAYPSYGELNITGGNCPVYADNCYQQTTHWVNVGCGDYTQVINYDDYNDDDDDENPTTGFFTPYATSGSLKTSMNPLSIVEDVIYVFGTIWLFSSAWQIYEVRYLIFPRSPYKQKTKRGSCSNTLLGMVTLFGVIGAFVAALMSIGGHMSQALGSHHSIFLDSFGPEVVTNQTFGRDEFNMNITVGTEYWGNATSWSDCFAVGAPRSGNGWWGEWVAQNRGRLFRIPAGV